MSEHSALRYHFRYHPAPLSSGAFQTGDAVCACCGRPTPVFYCGPFYAQAEDLTLCPGCIATGEAARRFDGCFTAPDCCDDVGDEARRNEIAYRTPGYQGLQQEHWLAHCGDYCAYIGPVTADDMTPALWAETAATWADRPQRWRFEDVRGSLGLQYEGYLFRCLVCGKHLLYLQRD